MRRSTVSGFLLPPDSQSTDRNPRKWRGSRPAHLEPLQGMPCTEAGAVNLGTAGEAVDLLGELPSDGNVEDVRRGHGGAAASPAYLQRNENVSEIARAEGSTMKQQW